LLRARTSARRQTQPDRHSAIEVLLGTNRFERAHRRGGTRRPIASSAIEVLLGTNCFERAHRRGGTRSPIASIRMYA
jgi:hypothetical protein